MKWMVWRVVALCCTVVSGAMVPGRARAAEQSVTVQAGWEYAVNPLLRPGDESSVARYRVRPTYLLSQRGESMEWSSSWGATLERSNRPDLVADRNDPAGNIDWKLLLPTSTVGLHLGYTRASVLSTELLQTGIATLDHTSTEVSSSIQWQKALSGRWAVNAAVSEQRMDYDTSSMTSYRSTSVSAGWSYEVSDASSVIGTVTANRFEPGAGGLSTGPSRYTGWSLGYNANLSPGWGTRLQMGWAHQDSDAGQGEVQGDWQLDYKGERSTVSMSVGRHMVPSGAVGGYVSSRALRWAGGYAISERSRASVGYDSTRSSDAARSAYQSVTLGWHLDLSPRWELSWTWRRQNVQATTGSANGAMLGLSLNYLPRND